MTKLEATKSRYICDHATTLRLYSLSVSIGFILVPSSLPDRNGFISSAEKYIILRDIGVTKKKRGGGGGGEDINSNSDEWLG